MFSFKSKEEFEEVIKEYFKNNLVIEQDIFVEDEVFESGYKRILIRTELILANEVISKIESSDSFSIKD